MQDNFYYSSKWRSKRKKILKRDKYLCVECKRYGRKDTDGNPILATTVHHIQHRESHPELSLTDSNLVSLCDACHNKMHPERGTKHKKINPPRY